MNVSGYAIVSLRSIRLACQYGGAFKDERKFMVLSKAGRQIRPCRCSFSYVLRTVLNEMASKFLHIFVDINMLLMGPLLASVRRLWNGEMESEA